MSDENGVEGEPDRYRAQAQFDDDPTLQDLLRRAAQSPTVHRDRDALIEQFVTSRSELLKRLADVPADAQFLTPEEALDLVTNHLADPVLDDLDTLAGDTTDDLGPIR